MWSIGQKFMRIYVWLMHLAYSSNETERNCFWFLHKPIISFKIGAGTWVVLFFFSEVSKCFTLPDKKSTQRVGFTSTIQAGENITFHLITPRLVLEFQPSRELVEPHQSVFFTNELPGFG